MPELTMPAVTSEGQKSEPLWDFMRLSPPRRVAVLAAFGLSYAALMFLGIVMAENAQLTIIWPAAGLLFIALWFSPRRNWPWIVGLQVAVEISIHLLAGPIRWRMYGPFVLANALNGIVSALVAGRLLTRPEIPRIQHVLRFFAAVAAGAAASAVLGAFGMAQPLNAAHYWSEWQLWWAGKWLGSLCIAPAVMSWAVRWRAHESAGRPAPATELALIGAALIGMTIWIFSARPGSVGTILDLPFTLLALVIVAACRLPVRWSTAFAAVAALTASYFASRGHGPFASEPDAFVRIGAAQLYLVTLVVINFMLAIVLLEMRNTMRLLRGLNHRLHVNQERLQLYARQLVGAEERARRATAVDLHDGIGQQLVGLAMTLEAAESRGPSEVRLLLDEAIHTAREVQSITRRVIADLSPPGLYELGLEPALKWLGAYMRSEYDLRVELRIAVGAAADNLELRVLVFKLIRELLRNVVKHAGVQAASVTVTQTPAELRVVVEDHGVGFRWRDNVLELRSDGFGLWSVAERVRAAAGEMVVDTAPGQGCRISVAFPPHAMTGAFATLVAATSGAAEE